MVLVKWKDFQVHYYKITLKKWFETFKIEFIYCTLIKCQKYQILYLSENNISYIKFVMDLIQYFDFITSNFRVKSEHEMRDKCER